MSYKYYFFCAIEDNIKMSGIYNILYRICMNTHVYYLHTLSIEENVLIYRAKPQQTIKS